MKKNALITGASSEIIFKIAESLQEEYHLILIEHNSPINTKILKEIPDVYKCDLNDKENLEKIITEIKNKYKQIDLIINGAAYSKDNDIDNILINDLLNAFKINVIAPFYIIKKLYNKNLKVINILSTDGIDTYNEYNLPYATSKSALLHLTKQLAYIYKDIHIYGLVLNYVDTKTTKEMNQDFLEKEMKRINQKYLVKIESIIQVIQNIINNNQRNGTIIRMDDNNEYKKIN